MASRSRDATAQSFERPPHAWFALDLELGAGVRTIDTTLFARPRVRAGFALATPGRFWSIAGTLESQNLDRLAVGVLGDLYSLDSAVSVYAGATMSQRANVGLTLGVGWHWFALEAQLLFDAPTTGIAVIGLRIPVGGIAYGLWSANRPYRVPMPSGWRAPSATSDGPSAAPSSPSP